MHGIYQIRQLPPGWSWRNVGDLYNLTPPPSWEEVAAPEEAGFLVTDYAPGNGFHHATSPGRNLSPSMRAIERGMLLLALDASSRIDVWITHTTWLRMRQVVSPAIVAIRPRQTVDPRYGYCLFRLAEVARQAESCFSITAKGALLTSPDRLAEILVPVPDSLDTQARIGAQLLPMYDESDQALTKARASAREIRQLIDAVYHDVFSGSQALTWPNVAPLRDLLAPCPNAPLPRPDTETKALQPIFSSEAIEPGLGLTLSYGIVRSGTDMAELTAFPSDTILYSVLRPHLRKAALVTRAGYCSPELLPLRAKAANVGSSFLLFTLLTARFAAHATSLLHGITSRAEAWDRISGFLVRFPDQDGQRRVEAYLTQIRTEVAALAGANQQLTRSLEAVQGSLLVNHIRRAL